MKAFSPKNHTSWCNWLIRFSGLLLLGALFFPHAVFGQPKDNGKENRGDGIDMKDAVVFYINGQSKIKNPDGSSAAPFTGLRQAFEKINQQSLRKCTLYIASGTYREKSLEISCPIVIKKWEKGPLRRPIISNTVIRNKNGFSMQLHTISLDQSRIEVFGNATFIMKDVDIAYAPDCALAQEGGRLSLTNVSIIGTRAIGKGDHAGTGLHLYGGVTAVLTDLSLQKNDNGALRLDGNGTRVYANNIEVGDNGWRGENTDTFSFGSGAVEITRGAVLYVENGLIAQNDYIGLFLFEGGKAHIRQSVIERTRSIRTAQGERGGTNIVVCQKTPVGDIGKTELELSEVTTRNAAFCGVQVLDAWIYCRDVTITGNLIGLNFDSPRLIHQTDLDACFYNTTNFGNEVDYGSVNFPVPEGVNPLDDSHHDETHTASTACAHVSFEVLTIE